MSATNSGQSIEINWQWWDAQVEARQAFYSGDYDVVVLRTGYGGGKTITGARLVHEVSLAINGSHNLVLAPDFQKGGPATYAGFFEELPGEDTVPNDANGDPENSPIVAGYNQNEKRLTYRNGSVARLGSADTWSRYAGSEFNVIWCDEVSHYGTTDLYDLREMLVTRQRTEEGPNVMFWTSTGNGYDQFYDITERKVDQEGDPLTWGDRLKVVVGSTANNPFLPEKEKMLASFEGTAREEQALHGGFAAAEGLVYNQFSRNTHVVSAERANELASDNSLFGYDHGWKDKRVVVDCRKTPAGQYLVYDLFYRSESKYTDAVRWLTDNEKPIGTIYSEHEPEHQEAFRQAGYPVEPAIKDLDEGIPAVRERLEVDEEGRPGLLINEECSAAVQEFLSYKEEHVGKSVAVDHFLDALRYLIMGDTMGTKVVSPDVTTPI